jgi:3-keto-disaccharide hydrolase
MVRFKVQIQGPPVSQQFHTRRRFLQASAALLAGAGASLAPAAEEGFTPLFDGQSLAGWEGDSLLWVVEDGTLIGRSPGISYNDFLATEKSFSNFILRLQAQLVDNSGNSGVQFRSERVTGSMEMAGYQADIGPEYWGNLYDESRRKTNLVVADPKVLKKVLKPTGWNEYEIHAEGPHIVLKINGGTTADYTETDASVQPAGRIAVQIHSGPALEVRFRDIRIKEL